MAKLTRIHKDKAPIRMHFIPEWAKHRRKRQKDIVEGTGIEKSTVSRWFKGSVPQEKHLIALAGFLEAEEPVDLFRHPDDDWLSRLFRRSPEKERQRIINAVRAFLGEEAA